MEKSLRTSPDTVPQSEPKIFLKMVFSSCELATYISPSPYGKKLPFQRSDFMSATTVYSGEEGKGVVGARCVLFSGAPRQSPKKLAGVLHDRRGYYWRTFPPGPFVTWNGNWMSEFPCLVGQPCRMTGQDLSDLSLSTHCCVTTLLSHEAADCNSETHNCYFIDV